MSLFAAVFLAAPVLFFQAWKFIAPGLYKSERRMVLPFVFFSPDPEPVAKRQICSVLAGYVWDETNPYVQRPKRQLARTAQLIRLREEARRAGASTR